MKYEVKNEFAFLKNRKAVQKTSNASMVGKTCVISGATSGVGFEALKKLAENKANIIMIARNKSKAEYIKNVIYEQYNIKPDIFMADFSNLEEVKETAVEILKKYPVIDVLINSAGLHSTKRKLTIEGFELVYCVNHLASFLFTMLLLDSIKRSDQGRIIQVNSEGHRFGGLNINDLSWKKRPYIGLRGYGASKTAQLMTVIEMSERLSDTNVTVNAMHPGGVRTNIGNNNGFLYKLWLKNVVWHFLKDPVVSGESLYYLASSSEVTKTSGKYFNLTIEEKAAPHVFNESKIKAIWDISMKQSGLV